MTLVVCLKARDCIVISADSLTSLGGEIVSCTTEKLHQVGTAAVTVGCGLSRVQGIGWGPLLANFRAPPNDTAIAVTVSQLQAFLNEIVGRVPRSNVGACQGGNTFLLAGHDVANSGMAVARLTRLGDRRQFEAATTVSNASDHNYIEWIGDTMPVSTYIATKTAQYVPDMSQDAAVDFAIKAIIDGIAASLAMGNHTIGGEFVSVALVSASNVTSSRHATGIPCMVTAMIGSSSAAPDDAIPLDGSECRSQI